MTHKPLNFPAPRAPRANEGKAAVLRLLREHALGRAVYRYTENIVDIGFVVVGAGCLARSVAGGRPEGAGLPTDSRLDPEVRWDARRRAVPLVVW